VFEVAPDSFRLSSNAPPVLGCGFDKLQLRNRLLDGGIGHLVEVEFRAKHLAVVPVIAPPSHAQPFPLA